MIKNNIKTWKSLNPVFAAELQNLRDQNTSIYRELHIHTEGSYRDAVTKVPELFERTKELGRDAVAITDHGNMTRTFEAFKYATKMQKKAFEEALKSSGAPEEDVSKVNKAFGDFGSLLDPEMPEKLRQLLDKYPKQAAWAVANSVKFIPGVEMYTQGPEDEKSTYHIILLAKDWEGAKAIFKVSNLAQLNKGGRLEDMPRVTLESLNRFIGPGSEGHGHVIATSACMTGHLSSLLLSKYKMRVQIAKLQEDMESLGGGYPAGTLELYQKALADAKEEQKEAKESLKLAKALANKKVESKIERLKNKIDKMLQKSLDTSAEESELDALYSQAAAIENAKEKLPVLEAAVIEAGEKVDEAKVKLATVEKAVAPQLKLEAKIAAVKEALEALPEEYPAAKAMAQQYNEIFGQGNYYIELQNHGIDEEFAIEQGLRRIAKELGIPMTIANDVHFCRKEDEHKRNLIASMRFNKHISEAETQAGNSELYIKSDAEMLAVFPDDVDILKNSIEIADKCNVFYHKEMHLPVYTDEVNGYDPERYLREKCREGFRKRYPNAKKLWPADVFKMYGERVNYELGVIHKMGFDSYIAIVQDFIAYGRNTYGQLLVGPGRGSGAGSLVCYLLGITDIDPMRYGLIFERFLNPERVSMPDIDTDFAPSIRDGVVEYVTKKYEYKEEYAPEINATVANIATEGTLAARGAIRSVGRVLYGATAMSLCDKLAKFVPAVPGMTLKKALEDSPELRKLRDSIPEAKRIIEDAMLVEGIPVNSGVHAAGVVITDKPISEYSPMFWNDEKNCWVIQFDMIACEADLGCLKMDFLGLKNLDIINDAMNSIKGFDGTVVSVDTLQKADDIDVLRGIYAKGRTNGVFQFESGGMKRTLRDFQPSSIDDVILLNAAYRPGPMDYIPRITDVKLEKQKPQYIIPDMEKIIGVTYGSPIYQEQIMQLFQEVGFSLGQADIIRRAMSKKHLDEIEAAKDQFVAGMKAKGGMDEEIEKFWQELLEFAKYAFNKSHAAAYSVVSYYTAWLKYYYPAEYISALMSHSDNSQFDMYINDAKYFDVEVLPPDVNASFEDFVPELFNGKKAIRFGLSSIKGMGVNAKGIVDERKANGKYNSYSELVARCVLAGIQKKALYLAVQSGATESLGGNYNMHLKNAEFAHEAAKKELAKMLKKEPEMAYEAQLEALVSFIDGILVHYDEMLAGVKARMMKECLGTYLSNSPLEGIKLPTKDITFVQDMTVDGAKVKAAGYIDDITVLARKSDGAPMAKFTFGDNTGSISAICFTTSYANNKELITEGNVVIAKGRLKVETDESGETSSVDFIVSEIEAVKQ